MSKKSTYNFGFEVKATSFDEDEDFYIFEGIASTPDIDNAKDIVLPEAMAKSMAVYGAPKFCLQHDSWSGQPLGVIDKMEVQGVDTIIKARMPKGVQQCDDSARLAKMGAYGGLSIGYIVEDSEMKDGIRVIKELRVFEVSLVTLPCNENAKVLSVKKQGDKMELKGENLKLFLNGAIKAFCSDDDSKNSMIVKMASETGFCPDSIKSFLQADPSKEEIEEAKNLKEVEAQLKSYGMSNKAAETVISKVKALSLGDQEKGDSEGDLQDDIEDSQEGVEEMKSLLSDMLEIVNKDKEA